MIQRRRIGLQTAKAGGRAITRLSSCSSPRQALLLILCWQLVQPFMGPVAWAFALAVVGHPLHGWIARRVDKPGLTAGLAVIATR